VGGVACLEQDIAPCNLAALLHPQCPAAAAAAVIIFGSDHL